MYGNEYESTMGILGVIAMFGTIVSIMSLAIGIVMLVSLWKIYKKAGKGGWEAIIPIYNVIVLLQIAELPLWYIVLYCIPFVNIYAIFKTYIELAHRFGKSTGFGVATVFFSFICLPILAFGKTSVYNPGKNVTSNNGMPQNQTNVASPFQTGINNLENNAPVTDMFNQNVNTQINPIPSTPNILNNPNNMQQVTPVTIPEQPLNAITPTPIVENTVPTEVNTMPQQVAQTEENSGFVYNPNGMNVQEPAPIQPTEIQPQVVNPNVAENPVVTPTIITPQQNPEVANPNVVPNIVPTQNNNPTNVMEQPQNINITNTINNQNNS